jgi:hypothetical protein
MKVAITDACIFIELHHLLLTSVFFKLDIEIHTTVDVLNELYPEQCELLQAYEAGGKLHLHSLTDEDRLAIRKNGYTGGLSETDKTVLYIAGRVGAMILSSDKPVRKQARKCEIEFHGMFWIFDRLIESGLITMAMAAEKLRMMMLVNIIYQNSAELNKEMAVRLERWK